jgi:anti-sigma regulatory factor (Ser/Thr protein kinase)
MGQLRGAVRSLAPFCSPSEVLSHLDGLVTTMESAKCATVALLEYDPIAATIAYACAGHPPPLLVPSKGRAEYLWEGRSVPLGAVARLARTEASCAVSRDDVLVLYTDGLIERRGANLDDRFAQLLHVASTNRARPFDHFPQDVVAALLDGAAPEDDIAVLALRFQPARPRIDHGFTAAPDGLFACRAAVRSWLRELGVSREDEHSLLVAVGEATANAVEHAYAGDAVGKVDVSCEVTPEREVTVVVYDEGTWRHRPSETNRGRGRALMAATVDRVETIVDERGTRVRLSRRLTGGVPDGRGRLEREW